MEAAVHVVVEGVVQGVGFRWFVARKAQSLGVHGYARNLAGGGVEVQAEGEKAMIEELIRQLRIGPRAAHVSGVHVEWLQPSNTFTHFDIR